MNMKFGVAAGLMAVAFSAQALDLNAGKTLADQQCAACHAVDGNWNKTLDESYPKLAGQHADYLAYTLREYQNGGRNNAIMSGIAAGLSRQDIRNLSGYFASLESELYLKK